MSSINLSEFVEEPYTDKAYFNSAAFILAVQAGVKALDILIDENCNRHPLKEQQQMSHDYRNIGLGVFGYATMLMKLGLEYGSEEAIKFTDDIFGLMFRAAVFASNERAKELGPYPRYKDCVWDSDIMKAHFRQEEIDIMKPYGLRNCSLLSIAPTGSIGTMLGESGGCEPEFALQYTRRTVGASGGEDAYYTMWCKPAREYMEINNTDELPSYFVCAKDIPWMNRIRTQAVMQRHVDTGISSTINLPHETTKEEVAELYLEAWKNGLKGVTIFREGCKRFPILDSGKKETKAEEEKPVKEIGKIRKLTTGCGSLHLSAYFNSNTGDLMEIFLNKGSSGGCNNFMIGLSRMVSLACKKGCDIYEIVDQLKSCGVCPSYAVRKAKRGDTSIGSCCPVAVGNALVEMYDEMQEEINGKSEVEMKDDDKGADIPKGKRETDLEDEIYVGSTCPVCHSKIEHSGGCDICTNCGWSKCE